MHALQVSMDIMALSYGGNLAATLYGRASLSVKSHQRDMHTNNKAVDTKSMNFHGQYDCQKTCITTFGMKTQMHTVHRTQHFDEQTTSSNACTQVTLWV